MTTLKIKDKEQMMSLTITHSNIKKAVKSFTMSKRYINTMLRASIINILYHRLNIGDKEFSTKVFNKIPFKTFKPKSKNLLIRDFHTYMTACKDAIEKNYLREFYLYFIDSSGDIVENYKFSFKYNEKQDERQSQSDVDLTKHTCDLLETLNDLGRHNKLEADVHIKVEFTYFDETPEDYEPPGFRGINESESLMTKLSKSGNSVLIGTLFTGFHTLKCRGRGKIFNFDFSQTVSNVEIEENELEAVEVDPGNEVVEAENNNEVEVENDSEVQIIPDKRVLTQDDQVIELSEVSDIPSNNPTPARNPVDLNETNISQYINVEDSDTEEFLEIDCPCQLPASLGAWSPDIIKCELCKRQYHAPCQGYLDKTFLGGPFHCSRCIEDCESIVNLLGGQTQTSKPVFRTRYIVACVYKLSKIPNELQSLFQQTAESLKLSVFNGNDKKINEELLQTLFKFNHKSPDPSKLIVSGSPRRPLQSSTSSARVFACCLFSEFAVEMATEVENNVPAQEAKEIKEEAPQEKAEEAKQEAAAAEAKEKEPAPPKVLVHKTNYEKDVVYLYQFSRTPLLPSLSPFCLKVESWLRLAAIKYENVDHKMKYRSKKGQLPFVEINGEEIADSTIIIKELSQRFGHDLDAGLTTEQRNIAHATISMVENHLAWVVMWWRTKYPELVLKGYKVNLQHALGTRIPNGILNFFFKFAFGRKWFQGTKKVKAQGIGVHSAEEINAFGQGDLKVLSDMLADKPFFFGDEPTTLDVVVFAQLAQIYFIDKEVSYALRDYMTESCPNLVGLVNRMKERCFPDWDDICTTLDLNSHLPKPAPEESKDNKEGGKDKEKEGDQEKEPDDKDIEKEKADDKEKDKGKEKETEENKEKETK